MLYRIIIIDATHVIVLASYISITCQALRCSNEKLDFWVTHSRYWLCASVYYDKSYWSCTSYNQPKFSNTDKYKLSDFNNKYFDIIFGMRLEFIKKISSIQKFSKSSRSLILGSNWTYRRNELWENLMHKAMTKVKMNDYDLKKILTMELHNFHW